MAMASLVPGDTTANCEIDLVCLSSKLDNIVHVTIINTEITMPPILRKRGRPKGHEVTVIGLPAKKVKKSISGESRKRKLQPFKLHTSLKEEGM